MKKLMTIFGAILFASVFLTSCGDSGSASVSEDAPDATTAPAPSVEDAPAPTEARETETNTINDNNASEETSKKVYRQGYSDGQTGYGLPASERGSASEFYMSRGYNYSSADYYVYEMGYNDGVYGRSKKY
jgi:hypothetical protein